MDPITASALIGGGIAVANAGLSHAKSKRLMKIAHKYEKENMALQNQYMLEQWNRENQYNDPVNVANRYARAGVNPLQPLQDGGLDAGIAGSFGSSPTPTTSANPVNAPIDLAGSYIELRQLENSSLVSEAQANKINAEADYYRSLTPTSGNLGDSQLALNKSLSSLHDAKANLSNVQASTEEEKKLKLRSETVLNEVIAEREKWNVRYNAETFNTRVAHQKQSFLQAVEDYNHSLKMNPLLREQAHSNAEYLYENALYAIVQKQLASKRQDLTEAQIAHYVQQDENLKNTIAVELKKLGFTGEMIPYEKAEKVINSVANVANSVSRIIMAFNASKGSQSTNIVNSVYDDSWATSPSNNF